MVKFRTRLIDLHDDEDVEHVRELHKNTFADTAPMPELDYGDWWLVYPAADRDSPIAFAGLVVSSYGSGFGYLKRAGVLTCFRGEGLQRRLISLRERRARKLGMQWSITNTSNTNSASSNNLIRSGYHIWVPENPWDFATSIYWRKKL